MVTKAAGNHEQLNWSSCFKANFPTYTPTLPDGQTLVLHQLTLLHGQLVARAEQLIYMYTCFQRQKISCYAAAYLRPWTVAAAAEKLIYIYISLPALRVGKYPVINEVTLLHTI
jgi:hypothetical protein